MAANPEIVGLPSPYCSQAPKVVLLDLDLTPDPQARCPMPAVYIEAGMQLWAVDQVGDESRPQRPEADVTL